MDCSGDEASDEKDKSFFDTRCFDEKLSQMINSSCTEWKVDRGRESFFRQVSHDGLDDILLLSAASDAMSNELSYSIV